MTASTSKTQDVPTQNMQDLAVLIPMEGRIEIAGFPCRVKRIRMRELMLITRVITNGAGQALGELDFKNPDVDSHILAVLMMAIPNAQDEFVELVRALVEPERKLDKAERLQLDIELENPEADVALDVIQIVAAQESDTFRELLGKGKQALGTMRALYMTKKKDS